jgi:hypothetical protein
MVFGVGEVAAEAMGRRSLGDLKGRRFLAGVEPTESGHLDRVAGPFTEIMKWSCRHTATLAVDASCAGAHGPNVLTRPE